HNRRVRDVGQTKSYRSRTVIDNGDRASEILFTHAINVGANHVETQLCHGEREEGDAAAKIDNPGDITAIAGFSQCLQVMEDIGVFPRPTPGVQWIARPDVVRTAEGRFVLQEHCLLSFERSENLPPFGAAQIGQRRKTGSRKQALPWFSHRDSEKRLCAEYSWRTNKPTTHGRRRPPTGRWPRRLRRDRRGARRRKDTRRPIRHSSTDRASFC